MRKGTQRGQAVIEDGSNAKHYLQGLWIQVDNPFQASEANLPIVQWKVGMMKISNVWHSMSYAQIKEVFSFFQKRGDIVAWNGDEIQISIVGVI
jgi:hypothetical protein